MVELTNRNLLTLKCLISIIFCLIGFQYLSILQVNDNQRLKGRGSLFLLDKASLAIQHHSPLQGSNPPLLNTLSRSVFAPAAEDVNVTILSDHATPSSNNASSALPDCPLIPPGLHGPIKSTIDPKEVPDFETMQNELFTQLSWGGRFHPTDCKARHRVAVIVPFRDRQEHLRILLYNLHSLLPRQQLDYGIYVIEQNGNDPFNRAMLFNVGVAEALKQHDYQCFIFHDVDLMPEDDRNIYSCPVQPRHMSVAINKFHYKLPYDGIFGGVCAMTLDHFRQVNGFSNKFWGWGGEDDDMRNRLLAKKLYISRYPANIARYKMISHPSSSINPDRFKYLYSGTKRMDSDGYNSVKYKRVELELNKLYTWVLVDLPRVK